MSLTPSNINEITDSIIRSGVAYGNRYEVLIVPPSGLSSRNYGEETKQRMIRCDSVLIPGRALSTVPYRYYGPARNMPYEPIYAGELTMTMLLSADLRERKFFEDWIDLICSKTNYKFGFYDDYVSKIEINVLTKDEFVTYKFIVEEVYPKALGDLQVGYDKENDFLRQDITLSFRKYTPVYVGQPLNINIQSPQLQTPQFTPPQAAPTPPPLPRSAEQLLVKSGGKIYRMGSDGTVNGIYDPQKYAEVMRSGFPLMSAQN